MALGIDRMEGSIQKKAQTWFSGLVVVAAALAGGYTVSHDQKVSQSEDIVADNATVQLDRVPIIPASTGTITNILVKTGDQVVAGQVIATFDDRAILAAIEHDHRAIALAQNESLATQAAILPPPVLGTLPPPSKSPPPVVAPVVTAPTPSVTPDPAVVAATDKKKAAQKALLQAQAAQAKISDQVATAKSDLSAATQQDQTAHSKIEGLEAGVDMAKSEQDKFKGLYTQGIISRAEFQRKQTDFDAAQAAVTSAQKQITDADALVKQRQDAVDADQKLLDGSLTKSAAAQKLFDSIVVPNPTPAPVTPAPFVPTPKPAMPPPLPVGGPLPRSASPFDLAPVGVAFSPIQHQKAQSQVTAAQAALERDNQALVATRLVSTTDGVVASIDAQPGTLANPSRAIVTLLRPTTARVIATLPHGSTVKPGAACVIQVVEHPQERFSGTVQRLVGTGSPTVQVEIQVNGDPAALGALPAGTALRVTIHTH